EDLVILICEEDRLCAELAVVSVRIRSRINAVREAEPVLGERRVAAGLPFCAVLPLANSPRELLAAVGSPAEEGTSKLNASRITVLRWEETELRVALEQRHIEAEEREVEAQRFRQRREVERKADEKRQLEKSEAF